MKTTLTHKPIFDIKAQVLTLPDDVSDAQLAEAYNTIESLNSNLNWWRGDLYAHVAKVRPTKRVSDWSQLCFDLPVEQNERVQLMMEQSAHPRALHRMACRVSAVLAPDQRKPGLSWDYHAVVLEECGVFASKGGSNLHEGGSNINEGGSNINEGGSNINEGGANINEEGANLNEEGSNINEGGANINEEGANLNEEGANLNEGGSQMRRVANALRWLDWVVEERGKGESVSISDLRQMIRDTRAGESAHTISEPLDATPLSHVLREAQGFLLQVRKLDVAAISSDDRDHLLRSIQPLVFFFNQLVEKK